MFTQITDPTFTEQVTPWLPLIGTIFGAIVVGSFAAWNRKRGATENRTPDVNEIWVQQAADAKALDGERRHRRVLEALGRRVIEPGNVIGADFQNGGDTALNAHEQDIYDTDVPPAQP